MPVFDPFHGASAPDRAFYYWQYPWGNHDAVVEWQTWNGGVVASSGIVGVSPIVAMGTIIGFYDPTGFDQLLMRCTLATSQPNLQALALDNLHVRLQAPANPTLAVT